MHRGHKLGDPLTPAQVTEKLYHVYGTEAGTLFGIPGEQYTSVRAIVNATMKILEKEEAIL